MDKNYIRNLLKEALAALDEEDKAIPTELKSVYTARERVVRIARKYIGGKYKYGKKDMSQIKTIGVDCSGFTQGVFKEAGISLPNEAVNSIGQREWGVETKNPRPGDLVCYTERHVAIYVGNGEIIDAGNEKIGITKRNANIMPILCYRNLIGD